MAPANANLANIKMVIFDHDGTLAATEIPNNQATSNVLVRLGFPQYTLDYCLKNFEGLAEPAIKDLVERENNTTLPHDFLDQFVREVAALTEHASFAIPGAIDAVKALARSCKICVASNGERDNVTRSLKNMGLLDVFGEDHIFTREMVDRGKPAPDLFLLAAETCGVAAHEALVIEDSTSGVRAGKAAGMHVIGITAVAHKVDEARYWLLREGADVVLHSWSEILDYTAPISIN